MHRVRALLIIAAAAAAAACGDSYGTDPDVPTPARVVTGSGDITGAVAEFRTVLGDPVNGGAHTRHEQFGTPRGASNERHDRNRELCVRNVHRWADLAIE